MADDSNADDAAARKARRAEKSREYHKAHPEIGAKCRAKNREKRRAQSAAWWREHGDKYRRDNRERLREIAKLSHDRNIEIRRFRTRAFQITHPEKQRASEQKYRDMHKEKRKLSCAAYRAKPGVAKQERESRRVWCEANKDKLAAKAAARRALKMQATPAWADVDAIGAFYAEARRLTRETGIAHHVDHIVPLKSKLVCGLHCEANLQVLPGAANLSKGNRVWPNMF